MSTTRSHRIAARDQTDQESPSPAPEVAGDSGGGGGSDSADGPNPHSSEPEGEGAADRLTTSDLRRLIKELRRDTQESSKTFIKVNTPKEFSGAKRDECESFISACQLYFRAKRFKEDADRITFAGSYLIGPARRWFNTYDDDHALMHDWKKFTTELTRRHGEQDPEGSAIRKLETLAMKTSDHLGDFLVKFTEYQSHIHWENGAGSALAVRFYDMLPLRIKSTMTIGGRRHLKMDLYELQEAATDIDNDYWNFRLANQSEPDHSMPRAEPYSKDRRARRASSRDYEDRPGHAERPNHRNVMVQPRTSPASGSNRDPQSTARGLDSFGKLTTEENRRRFENNLCLICADPGHRRAECPKRLPRPAGRFKRATTTFMVQAAPSSELGN